MGTYSQNRLEEKILKAISLLIVQKEIKNRKVSSLISPVTVVLSKDNSNATVYVSGYGDEKVLLYSINGLNESRSFIQSKLADFLKTKNTPILTFKKDEWSENAEKVEEILNKIGSVNK